MKSFQVTNHSSAYWQGKADAETLQRVYGISFPDNKRLKEWQKFQAEAALRDHRKIGMVSPLNLCYPLVVPSYLNPFMLITYISPLNHL